MKRILLCDVDGVLADFVGGVCALLPPGTLTPSMVTMWGFIDPAPKGLLSEAHSREANLAISDAGFWRTLRPYDGAANALESIRSLDFEVVALTSPWDSCFGWAETRAAWLKRHMGFSRYQIITTPRKDIVRGDFFLDDKPEHVESWMRRNTSVGRFADERQDNARLFYAPYNARHQGPRVRGWCEVCDWLRGAA